MRRALPTTLVLLALSLACASTALAGGGGGSLSPPSAPRPHGPAARALTRAMNAGMRKVGGYSGAEVVDLTTGATLYSHHAFTPRLPASVEKLWTTTTALQMFGSRGRLRTTVLGSGAIHGATFRGTLYLRGRGDPTFGSASFDRSHYGTGASVQQLAARLHRQGIDALAGRIVADGSWFDADKGTPATGNRPSIEVEGELAGLDYNRGWANNDGTVYYEHPALEAGLQLRAAMRAAGIRMRGRVPVSTGRTPRGAQRLASAASPMMSRLIELTNTPSDNFFAETLIKDLGAKFGHGGTTASGVAVVRSHVASAFGAHPRFNDGSGLSRYDRTTPAQVIGLLRQMADDPQFTNSLAIAGRTGTLALEMRGTYAQNRCRGKTGTLHDVSNVVGYCRARNGDTLAYALLMNGIVPDYAHPIQDRMEVAIARYDG
ncbi:MAG TPA: D-alanyl-D-alanine carboxypeptidase [Solirubrobacteraceae bacterium]|nr:D-alanyl-D-alanine carboxypeptidase [Solirubrobacteraceae bacterium]